ncbi:hypothetical protein GF352_04120 [archaeon]|nr:hypothetical protein [archaeon]
MTFKKRFEKRFKNALRAFGLEKHELIKNQFISKEHPLRETVDIISGNIGREWGLATRIHTLEKQGLSEDSPFKEKQTVLKKAFKEHMDLRGIPIHYGSVADENTLVVSVGGCVFKLYGLIPKRGYSIGFLNGYFQPEEIEKAITYCDKTLDECEGLNCEVWLKYK